MVNIFENTYFGKPYKTKDGRKAIYVTCDDKDFNSHPHQLIQEETKLFHYYNDFGEVLVKYDDVESEIYDIVSEWKEEINEEELNKLARDSVRKVDIGDVRIAGVWIFGFKAGYRKALER